jgi:hypothetical protein
VFTSINPPLYKLGQGVFHDGLKILLFDRGDMHRPSPAIEESTEFYRGLSVKQIQEFCLSLGNLRFFSSVWTFETNVS